MKNMVAAVSSFFAIALISCAQSTSTSSKNSLTANATRIKVGNAPGSIEAADFNNDQITDFAITSESDSSVTILLGKGKSEFYGAPGSPFSAGNIPNDIAIGDFNKDGNQDLAFANHDRKYLTVLLGNGKGSFAAAPNSPFFVESSPHVHGVATGDFNGDGRPDLATDSWGNNEIAVLFGNDSGLFKTPGKFFGVGKQPYQRLRSADINGDGISDIVTTNLGDRNVTILLGDSSGNFKNASGSPFSCGDAPFNVSINDLNGDGKRDLAIVNAPASTAEPAGTNGLTVLLGDGTGNFTMMKGSPFKAGNIPNRVATGDINGDGVNDVVVSDNSSDKIYVYLMSKEAKVTSQSALTVGNHPKGIVLADLNADRKADIVVCNNADNDILIIISQ